jgi:toprim domain protein
VIRVKPVIIVEGKNDKFKLSALLDTELIDIHCTFGTPGEERLDKLRRLVGDRPVYIWTDNDARGKKIRALLRDAFPDAEHLHTSKGYAGVEGTPDESLTEKLIKAGLEQYLLPDRDGHFS